MNKSDFNFHLPEELIAQTPTNPRDHSKLLVMDKKTGELTDKYFYDIIDYLNPGDLLVLNDSRVLPARLFGEKEHTGGAMQFLLLQSTEKDVWEVMVKPGKKAKAGARFVFGDGLLTAEILGDADGGNRYAKFYYEGNFFNILDKIGNMPLPHYITHKLDDKERYQTVYSKEVGSSAAPTAGLHFTPELLQKIRDKGVGVTFVTLHVGLGTFRPVKVENILEHKMHSEHYYMPKETADLINQTKADGGKIICVGTTSCRTVESVATLEGEIKESSGNTNIFIYPGYKFKVLDGLITNFHLPESTLIMLVSALGTREHILSAYDYAVKEKYRFYSFGDAMLIGDTSK